MSNDWFSGFARLAKGSKARADAVNALFDLMVTGMDKMPTEIQMNSGTRNYISSDTGIADTYAGSLSHVSGSYGDGQEIDILIANTNLTTTPTLNVSTIGAVVIKSHGAGVIAVGRLAQNSIARVKYNATGSHWELMGVYDITSTVSAFMATMLDDATASAALTTLGITPFAQTLLDDATSDEALTTLGLIGSPVSFTPVLTDGVNDATLSVATGSYLKVGSLCFISIRIDVSSKGSLAGQLLITGFPLTPERSDLYLGCSISANLASRTDIYSIHGSINQSKSIGLKKQNATGSTAVQDTDISAGTSIVLSGVISIQI